MRDKKLALLSTGALTAVLVLGGIGVAYAETADDAQGRIMGVMGRAGGGLLHVVAGVTGLDIADVAERRSDGESFAAIAESEGVSTTEVKDAAVEAFEASLDDRMTSTEAPKGPRGPGGMKGAMGDRPADVLAEMAGIEVSEVREARAAGQSLAQIAEAEGVDIDAVIDATVASAEEALEGAVDDGRIDADRVDEILETMRERLTEMVDSTEMGPADGERGPGGGGPGGPRGPFGDDA